MIQEMASSNKGAAPDMGDLSDVSTQFCSFIESFSSTNVFPISMTCTLYTLIYRLLLQIYWHSILSKKMFYMFYSNYFNDYFNIHNGHFPSSPTV